MDVLFNRWAARGRELTGYLFSDVEFIDRSEKMGKNKTCQRKTQDPWRNHSLQWQHHIETGRASVLLRALSEALASTTVGDKFGVDYQTLRPINVEAVPWGFNIPIALTHSVGCTLNVFQYWTADTVE